MTILDQITLNERRASFSSSLGRGQKNLLPRQPHVHESHDRKYFSLPLAVLFNSRKIALECRKGRNCRGMKSRSEFIFFLLLTRAVDKSGWVKTRIITKIER